MNLGPKDASEIAVLYPERQVDSINSVFSQIVDLPVANDYRHASEEGKVTLANIQLTQLEAGVPGSVATPLYQAPMENPLRALMSTARMATHTKASTAFQKVARAANKPTTPPGLLKAPGYLSKQSQLPEQYLPFHPGLIDLDTGRAVGRYIIPQAENQMAESAHAEPVVKPALLKWVPDRFFPKFKPHPANIVHPMLRYGL